MTRVDFYLLATADEAGCERFACRLAEKAFRTGHRIYLNGASRQQVERLDELLWTFRPGSFVPHRLADTGEEELPVLIGCSEQDPGEVADVLINLADDPPPFFSRFRRVAEIVNRSPEQRAKGRARYRYYQERGYPLAHHNID